MTTTSNETNKLVRNAIREQMRGVVETRCVRQMADTTIAPQFEIRSEANGTGGTSLRFQGYASVVGNEYDVWSPALGEYKEVISPDAFTKTLQESPSVSFKLNHEGLPMATTTSGDLILSSDSTGLYSEAVLNTERADVKLMQQAIEAGHLNEMSFGFRCTRNTWSEDGETRTIDELNLHKGDVSVVEFGANSQTAGLLSLRAKLEASGVTSERLTSAFRALTGFNEMRTLDAEDEATIRLVLSLTSIADTAVDEAQIALSDLLGVENPDESQDAVMEATEPTDNETNSRRKRLAIVQLRAVAGR